MARGGGPPPGAGWHARHTDGGQEAGSYTFREHPNVRTVELPNDFLGRSAATRRLRRLGKGEYRHTPARGPPNPAPPPAGAAGPPSTPPSPPPPSSPSCTRTCAASAATTSGWS